MISNFCFIVTFLTKSLVSVLLTLLTFLTNLLYSVILATSFFTTLLSLLKSTAIVSTFPTPNLSTFLFELLKLFGRFFNLSMSNIYIRF